PSPTPGTSWSSGMKRMSWCSGCPQLASAAPVPLTAVSLMKSRRSMSIVTGEAIVRCVLLPVTVHAEAHVDIDVALRHRLLRDVAVAGGALHIGAKMRRVIEAHVRSLRIPVHALPRDVESALLIIGDLLDERPIGGDGIVAD